MFLSPVDALFPTERGAAAAETTMAYQRGDPAIPGFSPPSRPYWLSGHAETPPGF